jgi:hypothetical protein
MPTLTDQRPEIVSREDGRKSLRLFCRCGYSSKTSGRWPLSDEDREREVERFLKHKCLPPEYSAKHK